MTTVLLLERLAQWIVSLTLTAVPDQVRDVARTCLVDTTGVALAGTATAVAGHSRALALAVAAMGKASLLGEHRRLAAPAAAFANATAAHALDFDDNCYAGVVHGSAVVMPAALAIAETVNASGADFLTAFIAGSEAEYALGAATGIGFYERGWWTTGVFGPIGACAAAARLLRLDATATASALGIALTGTGGTKACFGTDAKAVLAGRASEAGVVAALLAARGITGPADALEHPRGFAHLLNDGKFDASVINALVAGRWYLLDPGIDVKRIPICLSAHAAVDAVRELIASHAIAAGDVARVVCDVPTLVARNLTQPRPRTRQEALFSMHFAIAATLLFGDVSLRQLSGKTISDPRLVELMDRVEMLTGSQWDDAMLRRTAPEGARVRIELHRGEAVETFCAVPRGNASRPLSAEEIDSKFCDCAGLVCDLDRVADLLGRLRLIEHLASIQQLFANCELERKDRFED